MIDGVAGGVDRLTHVDVIGAVTCFLE